MKCAGLVISALICAASGLSLSTRTGPSRGFVMCAAAPKRSGAERRMRYGHLQPTDGTLLWASVRRLRAAGNNDPVRVYHVDDELPADQIELIQSIPGVTVHDLKDSLDEDDMKGVDGDVRAFRSFFCKTMALVHSPFDQTMLMDADNLLFRNPATLWDHEVMKEKGTMFFKDRKMGDGTKTCESLKKFVEREDVKENLKPAADLHINLARRHGSLCEGDTAHEQDASLVVVNRKHPTASAFLTQLKKLVNLYLLKDKWTRTSWGGLGDKEFYWISCELAGVDCGFDPRGRPMHIFFKSQFVPKELREAGLASYYEDHPEEKPVPKSSFLETDAEEDTSDLTPEEEQAAMQDAAELEHANSLLQTEDTGAEEPTEAKPKKKRTWASSGPRTCIAHVDLDGDGSRLLMANMDQACDWITNWVNGATVWNADRTDNDAWGNGWWGYQTRTGKGIRKLSEDELATIQAYRDDVQTQEPETGFDYAVKEKDIGWVGRAMGLHSKRMHYRGNDTVKTK